MRRICLFLLSLLPLGPGAAAAGNVTAPPGEREHAWGPKRDDFKSQIHFVENRINALRKRLEEWGSVTVSAPIVMKKGNEFDLGPGTEFPKTLEYINLALTSAQGGVSQSTSTAFSNQLELTVTPTFKVNPLTGAKEAATLPANDTSLTPDAISQGPQFDLKSVLAPGTPGGSGNSFASPGSLIIAPNGSLQAPLKSSTDANAAKTLSTPSAFTLSGSQAAMIGTNAKISEILMRTMANPHQHLFTNPEFQIHFAIVEVSCNPGWRTRENYIADISATCEYYATKSPAQLRAAGGQNGGDDKEAVDPGASDQQALSEEAKRLGFPKMVGGKDENNPVEKTPLVFSVLPLIDAQTLELQNSERRFTQLAAALSAAYPTAAANLKGRDIIQFVKQFQKDTQTVTPRTVANSYSSGNTFGFRLMPSLTALKDPARSGSKPANILQATAFPVLVTVVISAKDFSDLHADSVRVRIANRWLINDRPPFKEIWRRIGLPMKREGTDARVNLAMDYGEAQEEYATLQQLKAGKDYYSEAMLTLGRDLDELRAKIIGVDKPVFCLPRGRAEREKDEAPYLISRPVVQLIVPDTITAQGKASIFLGGMNFFCHPSEGNAHVYIANAAATNSDDSGITVFLGQIKGLVRMCNSEDQMVVEFDGLEKLGKTESASLVIRTPHGALGWGKAFTVKQPAADATGAKAAIKSAKPKIAGQVLSVTVTGTGLGAADSAKLKLKQGGDEVPGAAFTKIDNKTDTGLVASFDIDENYKGGDDATIDLNASGDGTHGASLVASGPLSDKTPKPVEPDPAFDVAADAPKKTASGGNFNVILTPSGAELSTAKSFRLKKGGAAVNSLGDPPKLTGGKILYVVTKDDLPKTSADKVTYTLEAFDVDKPDDSTSPIATSKPFKIKPAAP